jgi:hypothetical protein
MDTSEKPSLLGPRATAGVGGAERQLASHCFPHSTPRMHVCLDVWNVCVSLCVCVCCVGNAAVGARCNERRDYVQK